MFLITTDQIQLPVDLHVNHIPVSYYFQAMDRESKSHEGQMVGFQS